MNTVRIASLLLTLLIASAAAATAQTTPFDVAQGGPGRVIEARSGDTIVVPADALVPVVRRTTAAIKIASNDTTQTVFLMIDNGPKPDGSVDLVHHFQLQQPFRPDLLWHGEAVVDEIEYIGQRRGRPGLLVRTNAGTLCFTAGGPPAQDFPLAAQCSAMFEYRGGGMRVTQGSFAEVEYRALNGIEEPFGVRTSVSMSAGFVGGVVGGGRGGVVSSAGSTSAAPGPVRVGGNIRQPQKTKDVAPVYPAVAQQAAVAGIVILEATIDESGKVSDARVLRSIPLLDQAAVDAVRQWEYEPTLLNGVPQRVIMTVPVSFPPR